MKNPSRKIKFVVGSVVALIIAVAVFSGKTTQEAYAGSANDAVLYDEAIKDAFVAMVEEICPLVVIDRNSNDVIWDEDSSRVLMATFHNVPNIYVQGRRFTLDRIVWLVSAKELIRWYKDHENASWNWSSRLKQLLGMPKSSSVNHFSLLWVEPKKMIRPAFLTDVKNGRMKILDEGVGNDLDSLNGTWYAKWFQENTIKSYGENGFPWTRLGYTYDWGRDDGLKCGLSEFLVLSNSDVDVALTKNVSSFLKWMGSQSF